MFDRRKILCLASVGGVAAAIFPAFAIDGAKRIVFIHGRGQQGFDPASLKATWLDTLKKGAHTIGRELPDKVDIVFPYYGDVLDTFAKDFGIPLVSEIHEKGGGAQDEFLVFQARVAEELRTQADITDAQVNAEFGEDVRPKGPLNWAWVQAILRALDKHGGGMSLGALETFTRDVFLYSTRAGVRDEIDSIVASALTEEPTVVVGHSLGSVVGYSVLRTDRRALSIPLYL